MQLSEEELPAFISRLLEDAGVDSSGEMTLIRPTNFLYIGTIEDTENVVSIGDSDIVLTVGPEPSVALGKKLKQRYLHLDCVPGKVGSRKLRNELDKLHPFVSTHLTRAGASTTPERVLVACPTGKDHSIGVALALLCLASNDDGGIKELSSDGERNPTSGLSKQIIKQKLSWISVSLPEANPSRTTLQSVNAFLLG